MFACKKEKNKDNRGYKKEITKWYNKENAQAI